MSLIENSGVLLFRALCWQSSASEIGIYSACLCDHINSFEHQKLSEASFQIWKIGQMCPGENGLVQQLCSLRLFIGDQLCVSN